MTAETETSSQGYAGLGEHAFEDDRAALSGAHPFDRPDFTGASILDDLGFHGRAPRALRRGRAVAAQLPYVGGF